MKSKAVLDAGPLIHLEQVNKLRVLDIIQEKIISTEVADEIGTKLREKADIKVKELDSKSKDKSKYIKNKYGLELGEATAISLSQQLDINLILTDDLDARSAAKKQGLEPHGTIGLVARAYTKEILNKNEAENTLEELQENSSLFLTTDLVNWAKKQIEQN